MVNMQYTVNKGEKGKVDIKVTIGAKDFSERYQKILETSALDAKIEGFRPGKAPLDVVEGRVGANKILNEAANYLVGVRLSEILKKENLSPIDSPKLAIDSLEKGKDFVFSVSFTQKPVVKVGDWKKIEVKKIPAKKITEKEIDESVKNIFEAWKKRDATTDKGQMTTEKSEDEEKEEEASKPSFAPTSAEAPDDRRASEGQGKFIYDAQGNKIYIDDSKGTEGTKGSKEEIKEPSDEWAKLVGATDLKHLKELVKKDLETLVLDQVETKYEQEIFGELRKIGEVEIPEMLVDDEVNRILIRISTELERQGKELKDYVAEQNTTIDALKAKWRQQAEENVRTSLILQEIGIGEKIQVTPEEMEGAMKGVGEQKLTDEQKKDLENYVAYNIFQAKTIDLIKKTISA